MIFSRNVAETGYRHDSHFNECAWAPAEQSTLPDISLGSFNSLKRKPIPMKRAWRADRDYPILLALVAIFISVTVIIGLIYNYAEVRQPGHGEDLSARISTPTNQQRPADL